MTHENNNIGGGSEHPGSDEQKISAMLTGLKRVEAPKDFDFHLKARIANARPTDYQRTRLFPILKYVMPLALFLVVGAGALVYSSYNAGLNVEVVEQPASTSYPAPAATAEPLAPPSNILAPDDSRALASASPEVSSPRRNDNDSRAPSNSKTINPGGGSRDFTASRGGNSANMALSVAPPPLTPKGMSSLNPMGVSEALRLFGAVASFENGAWVVKSVNANGIADQMGMKAGDKLKAIDGKPVGEKTEFQGAFRARTIQVQRGDTTVELGAASKVN